MQLVRDEKYPIRVTFQYFKVVDKQVNSQQVDEMATKIIETMLKAQHYGTLDTRNKVTSNIHYRTNLPDVPQWWDIYWMKHSSEYNCTKKELMEKLFGKDVRHLYSRPIDESNDIINYLSDKFKLKKK